MHSDFSTMAKSARAAIPVPNVALESIRSRSRALGNRDRLRMVVACGALALAAIGAGALGSKLYGGIQFWLSGDRGAALFHSLAIVNSPNVDDLRSITAKATFAVVYPVGMPEGTHLIRIMYAPADHPTSITMQYLNPRSGFQALFTLVDPTIVNATSLSMSSSGQAPRHREVHQWRVGGETVIAFKGNVTPAYARPIEDAMRSTSPAESLSANEAMLWKLRLLGGTFELADTADRLAPKSGGVLVDRVKLRLIPHLARTHQPLLAARETYLTNIPNVGGVPQFGRASYRWERNVAVPADGVRAIAAVMAAAGESGRWTDYCCEILYTPPTSGRYAMWTLPMSAAQPVKKYLVDAKTYRVRS